MSTVTELRKWGGRKRDQETQGIVRVELIERLVMEKLWRTYRF